MLSKTQKVFVLLAAAFYVFAGVQHFRDPEFYLKIVPPKLPWREAAVYVSGVAEIAGGVGLLIPGLRRAAAWGLVALLIAVFPANIYMAVHQVQATTWNVPALLLWLRLPVQGLLIWWVLWSTKTR
ncbi:MAG TPA: DoxX family protein [Bryobacteraceae bacterium]|nr:DoxX family protein [Bryobacteraceae bacterium]